MFTLEKIDIKKIGVQHSLEKKWRKNENRTFFL